MKWIYCSMHDFAHSNIQSRVWITHDLSPQLRRIQDLPPLTHRLHQASFSSYLSAPKVVIHRASLKPSALPPPQPRLLVEDFHLRIFFLLAVTRHISKERTKSQSHTYALFNLELLLGVLALLTPLVGTTRTALSFWDSAGAASVYSFCEDTHFIVRLVYILFPSLDLCFGILDCESS